MQPCNRVQGFGKAKNRVGMARPKNQKLEVVETTAEIGADADCDTRASRGGAAEPATALPRKAATTKDLTAGPGRKQYTMQRSNASRRRSSRRGRFGLSQRSRRASV